MAEHKENEKGNGEYYILDKDCRFILKTFTTEELRIKFKVIDWKKKEWTSTVELDKNFFHFKII